MRQIPFLRRAIPAILILCGMAGLIHAQSIDQQVLASSGREVKQGSVQLSFTVGELGISSFKADTLYLTQGYQQSFLEGSSPIHSHDLTFDLMVFPNPFSDVVTLRCTGQPPLEPVRLTWTDVAGHLAGEQSLQLIAGTDHALDLHTLPAGTYHVQLFSGRESILASFQLIHVIR
ncbi:MAG: T9SS type A sorting domain-containing protein [Saprospiraceae bacterium]|nr:T9SS type A sorting domain-containing protein [Saprospiraceae bacterium]